MRIGHHYLMDGGVAKNAPIAQAIELGADVVYALPAGYACGLRKPPAGALGMAVQALSLVLNQKLIDRSRESTTRWLGQGEPLRASLKRLQPHNH